MYTMEESLHLSKITIVSTWFRMVLTQIASWVGKDSLTLTYIPTKYQSLIGITNLILLLMLIVDTLHSPIYLTNTRINLEFPYQFESNNITPPMRCVHLTTMGLGEADHPS